MPSSIPSYHPSLVLGSIADPRILSILIKISGLQAKVEAAQDKLNSHISMKRSLAMTINELMSMNVDVSALSDKIKDVDTAIVKAATDYASIRLTNETDIQTLKEQIGELEPNIIPESPVDYNRTEIKKMPLSADSIKLDAQYFSYDENTEENPLNTIANIENYIKESASGLGSKTAGDVANTASAQINLQRKNHSISGTLIITATCTHKNAVLLTPIVIDVDKGIAAWNTQYADDKIDTADTAALQAFAARKDDSQKTGIPLLSGATYGSSFVGMIHILNKDEIGNSGSSITAIAAGLQERFKIGGWFEESSGGFGVDPSFSDDIKNLLSSQKITSHITVVVTGSVPSIKSKQVQMGVKTFADFDPAKMTAGLASIANITSGEKNTVNQAANAAKTGARALAMQGATIQSVMLGLGKIDQNANRMMDINSMMTAFENYLEEIKKGDAGVPINFYIKYISKQELVKTWLEKYYAEKDKTASAPVKSAKTKK